MTGYIIRRLPEGSIFEYSKVSRMEKRIPTFYIDGVDSFKIRDNFEIRPKAAIFAKRNKDKPIYVVLCKDQPGIDQQRIRCLFMFTLEIASNSRSERYPIVDICRCVGKTSVKRHWKTVIKFIFGTANVIYELSRKQYISFHEETENSDC